MKVRSVLLGWFFVFAMSCAVQRSRVVCVDGEDDIATTYEEDGGRSSVRLLMDGGVEACTEVTSPPLIAN